MATLPLLGKLNAKAEWNDQPNVVEMRFGNTSSRGTIGFNPITSTVRLTWQLAPEEVTEWLNHFAPTFNGRYWYESSVRGWVQLRPTGDFSYAEYGFVTEATMSFERVR